MHDRREFVRAALVALVGAAALPRELLAASQSRRRITIYKSPSCDCCRKWVELVKPTGWIIDVKDVDDVDKIKDQARVPKSLRSCHTAVVGRWVFEGHVPIDLMQAFLDRPRGVAGLAVPGMPVGSPGMEVPGRPADRFQVVGYYGDGRTFIYATR
ncbi:MAG: DUF411 domain-containing protein [Gemmatimonadaceae bacterium]